MTEGLSLDGAGRNTLKGRYPNEIQRGIMTKLIGACLDTKCPGTVPFDSLLGLKALDRLRPGQRRDVICSELRQLVSQGKVRQKGVVVGLTLVEAAALSKVLGCSGEEASTRKGNNGGNSKPGRTRRRR